MLSDNTPTVEWSKHTANKVQPHNVMNILREMIDIQRVSQKGPLTVASISGFKNFMADVASRTFGKNCVTETFFISNFSTTFPLPQKKSWRHVRVRDHLLRASGAMEIFLNGVDGYLIKKFGNGPVPRGSLTFTLKFPLFPQVSQRKCPLTMSYIIWAHKVVGPSSRFLRVFQWSLM